MSSYRERVLIYIIVLIIAIIFLALLVLMDKPIDVNEQDNNLTITNNLTYNITNNFRLKEVIHCIKSDNKIVVDGEYTNLIIVKDNINVSCCCNPLGVCICDGLNTTIDYNYSYGR